MILKMRAGCTFRMLEIVYQLRWHDIVGDLNIEAFMWEYF
jgi:hypothetical protein